MTTAELSIQFIEDALSKTYRVERTDERFDAEQWKRLEWTTPDSAGGVAPPVVEWVFVSSEATISIEPLADINGKRICRIPSFARMEIYPASFGFPPRLEIEYQVETEAMFLEVSRAEVAAGRPPPDKENALVRRSILKALWTKYRTAEEEKRWLQVYQGIGSKLFRAQYYQGGIFEGDLKRICFRADFHAAGSREPVSVFCATCEERVTSVTDARSLPIRPVEPTVDFSELVKRLNCKPATLRDYCNKLGFGRIKLFTPAQVAEIEKYRQALKRRPQLKAKNRTRHGHSAKPGSNKGY